jgi:hypothetical protein
VKGETPTLLCPLELTILNHWTTHVTITTPTYQTSLCRREITGKYAIKIEIKHGQTWKFYSTDGVSGRHKVVSQILRLILGIGFNGLSLLARFIP